MSECHLAIVAAEFPPSNTAGSVRPFQLASHIASESVGWKVTVFSLEGSKMRWPQNSNLSLSEIAFRHVTIKPARHLRNNRIWNWLLNRRGDNIFSIWGTHLFQAIQTENETTPFTHIIVTAPPFSSFSIIPKLRKKMPDVHLIADFRDAWAHWCLYPYPTKLHFWHTLRKEATVLKNVDSVLATTSETLSILASNPHLRSHIEPKWLEVPNGYDAKVESESVYVPSEVVKIGYVGTYYYDPGQSLGNPKSFFQYSPHIEHWLYRSPLFFFETLSHVIAQSPEIKVQFDHVGKVPDWLSQMAEAHLPKKNYQFHGFLPRQEVSNWMDGMDFLLGTSAKIEGRRDYSLGSKYFEIMGRQKPIIAFAPEGELKDFVLKNDAGVVIDPDLPVRHRAELLHELLTQNRTFYKFSQRDFSRSSIIQSLIESISNP